MEEINGKKALLTLKWHKRFERQGYHLLAYILLGLFQLWVLSFLPLGRGHAWGLSAGEWVAISWVFAGLFQGWIALFWRLELYGGVISARLGRAGFFIHRVGYGVLGFLRFFPLIPICLATSGTLPIPPAVSFALLAVSTPLILWALYAAVVHFGYTRASGADHFDPAYRQGTFEKKGFTDTCPMRCTPWCCSSSIMEGSSGSVPLDVS